MKLEDGLDESTIEQELQHATQETTQAQPTLIELTAFW